MRSRKKLRQLLDYMDEKKMMDSTICDLLDDIKSDLNLLEALMSSIKNITPSGNGSLNILVRLPEQHTNLFNGSFKGYKRKGNKEDDK